MARETFKLTGGRELEAALAKFSKPMAKAIARRALKRAADPILGVYQALTTIKTGNLEQSEMIGTKLTRRQARLARRLGKSDVELHIGTSDPAGVQEEFGNAHQSPHPSLRPAWDEEGGQKAVDRIADELRGEIMKTAARVARKAATS